MKKTKIRSVGTQTNGNRSPEKTLPRIFSVGDIDMFEFEEDNENLHNYELIFEGERTSLRDEKTRKKLEKVLVDNYLKKRERLQRCNPFSLSDIISPMRSCVENIVEDDFTEAFRSRPRESWNFNLVFMIFWLIGVLFRYFFLFPLRALIFLLGMAIFFISYGAIYIFSRGKLSIKVVRKMITFLSAFWSLSVGAVVKFHGKPPRRKKKQIFVANHCSLLDFAFLLNEYEFSSVGQRHHGFAGFFQNILSSLKGIWFERFESIDRKLVQSRILEHIENIDNPRLLIFPEGVCVNNEYIVMFKKGSFEFEDVEICPIAMKYDKRYCDPFWNSREESFFFYILRLMKEWVVKVDIYFLEPRMRKSFETPIEFANRVKNMIATKVNAKSVSWDGLLKYFKPSERYIKERQKLFGKKIIHQLELINRSKLNDEFQIKEK